jgi:A/G-specific adenine glycosylase
MRMQGQSGIRRVATLISLIFPRRLKTVRTYNLFSSMKSLVQLDSPRLTELRCSLLTWYGNNRRDLPWRNNRDPYRVWVSEIMLQQTRVAAVVVRYADFLKRFPSVRKLASARESSVLAQWRGLGYYRRARNLHAAAKIVARAGSFPQNSESWHALPGIGRYTSAAIASIAFNEPIAVLDGNVERVLRRLLGGAHSSAKLWNSAQHLLDQERPGDFNQAMMELGATICVPGKPQCDNCPIQKFCRTCGRGKSISRKPRQQRREIIYSLARRQNFVLLICRSKTSSLMPNMWELPEVASRNPSDRILFSLRHSITITDFRVRVVGPTPPGPGGTWVRISRMSSLPLTGLAMKILHRAGIIQ